MKIARRTPFDGPPRFTAPSVFCAAPGKPFLYRIPVLGKRPIHLHVFGLPDGLADSGDGILKGKPAVGIYPVTITAQNELGQTEHCLQLIVAEHCFRKPPIQCSTSISRPPTAGGGSIALIQTASSPVRM